MRGLAEAFAFLTRLPLRPAEPRNDDVGRSLAFFPVVGAALGIGIALLAWVLGAGLSPSLIGVGLVAVLAAVTGGLHLDGVADVFDGFGSGHGDRERTLAIMRDSRIGAHGAVALVLVILGKVLALSAVVRHHDSAALVAFPAVARWAVVPLVVYLPYVRPAGMGSAFKAGASGREVLRATAWVMLLIVAMGVRLVVPAVAALVTALVVGVWMQRRLGGLTGDVYGTAIELAELAFLVTAGGRA